jgi:hypothetical protein
MSDNCDMWIKMCHKRENDLAKRILSLNLLVSI